MRKANVMAWIKPEYSRHKVNTAGKILIDPDFSAMDSTEAFAIINNWRAAHNFPLNTFQSRLRRVSKEIDPNSIVAQRIKRIASIKHKLDRFRTMKLAQIQDIGGCRVILSTIEEAEKLLEIYLYRESRGIKHKLYGVPDDYIANPKESGYRGIHLVYQYYSEKKDYFNDLKIEIQIRTFLQHAWATAVETVGTFIKQSLKSSQGEEKWLRFFQLMASVMALKENRPTTPGTPDNYQELKKEIIILHKELDVIGHLTTFRKSLSVFDENKTDKDAQYYLLELDIQSKRVLVKSYTTHELKKATQDYLDIEKRIVTGGSITDAVLVSTDSLDKLRTAYPNYYLDTELFLENVKEVVFPQRKLKREATIQGELF